MLRFVLPALVLPALTVAQDLPDLPDTLETPEELGVAAETLAGTAADRVLVAGLIGSELAGPSGKALGTVENLVMLPGGRIVAALVEMPDGTRIAVPFQAVKIAGAAETARASVPFDAEELRDLPALADLATALDG